MNVISTNEPLNSMDSYQIVELIKYLQNSSEVSDKDLFNVEWAYLSLLDSNENASPEYLANRLASDPEFFCEAIQLLYRSKKDIEKERETGEEEKAIAENLWPLLHSSKKAPGIQSDGNFSIDCFSKWFDKVKELCLESDHLEIALEHVGQVLVYCPPDPDGLWIDKGIANELNAADAEHMRIGFRLEIFNSRGVHWIDPTGKPERALAEQYKQKADEVENAGFYRLATTLRDLADSYERDANRIIEEHKHDYDD